MHAYKPSVFLKENTTDAVRPVAHQSLPASASVRQFLMANEMCILKSVPKKIYQYFKTFDTFGKG